MPDVILTHVPAMAQATPVPVLEAEALSERVFLADHVAHGRPCVIRGAVSHWPATQKWGDPDYLKSRCSHAVDYWPHENHVTRARTEIGKRSVPFAEAVDLIHATPIASFGTAMPSLLDADLAGFSFFKSGELGFLYPAHRIFFFRNAGSAWHYHPFDETLMCEVRGPKKIGLLDVRNPFHRQLRRIFFREDYYDHPYAFEALGNAGLQWFSASLESGDALYIPPLWWHGVIATEDDVGATVPVVWRSTTPVNVDGIRKMASGEVDLLGSIKPDQIQTLLEFARNAGVEREFRAAWDRGVQERLVSVTAQ